MASKVGPKSAAAALGLLAATALAAGCEPVDQPRNPVGQHFAVMTYNVNWGMPQPEQAVRAIEAADADVVCLQETHAEWERLLRSRLTDRYGHMIFHHDRFLPGGLAVLSKFPAREAAVVHPSSGWFPSQVVVADTPAGPVQLLNVHLRPPLTGGGKVTLAVLLSISSIHRREIAEAFERCSPSAPVIVVGDFNESGSGAVGWLEKRGLRSALAQFDRHSHTWRWRTSLGPLRARYDHILYSEPLRCVSARVIDCAASDHRPVVAVFEGAAAVRARAPGGQAR